MRWEMKSSLAILAACTALIASATCAGAQVVSASCSGLRTTEFVTANAAETTVSTDWVNLNDAGSISFVSRRSGCIIVTLVALSDVPSDRMRVRIEVDGSTVCSPSEAQLMGGENAVDAVSMTYSCNVSKGTHTVQVQWETDAGNGATMEDRTLTVSHG